MPLPGDDELNEFVDANPHLAPPSNPSAPIVLPDNQLPFGFVPLSGPTTVMMASRSQTPRQSDQYAAAMLPAGLSYPDSRSRPSTAFEPVRESFNAYKSPTSRHRKMSLGSASSPAPLQRPISLFSDDAWGLRTVYNILYGCRDDIFLLKWTASKRTPKFLSILIPIGPSLWPHCIHHAFSIIQRRCCTCIAARYNMKGYLHPFIHGRNLTNIIHRWNLNSPF